MGALSLLMALIKSLSTDKLDTRPISSLNISIKSESAKPKAGARLITFLLICHGLMAVALLGAISHQTMALHLPARKKGAFIGRMRAVNPAVYTNAVIILYLIVFILGAIIYPAYRVSVRTWLEAARLMTLSGSFEAKEQLVTLGLGLLPFYWHIWRSQQSDLHTRIARGVTTSFLCAVIWGSFLVGHVLNNVRGLFGQ
jgi:hypothetical protein